MSNLTHLLFAGWEDCSRPLLFIVSDENRVSRQLISFIALIRLLKDRYNCLNGAVQLSKAIDSVIFSSDHPPKLTPSQISAYVNLCLEEDMQTANPERMPLLGPFCLNNLNTLELCCLVTHIADRHSALPLFTELFSSLVQKEDLNYTPDIEECAVELLLCCLNVNEWHIFNDLASKFLTNPHVVQVVLGSPEVWERANLDGGLDRAELVAVLPDFVKMRINTLAELVEKNPNPNDESFRDFGSQNSSDDDNQEDEVLKQHRRDGEKLRLDLSSALESVIRLMDAVDLTDLEGLAILQPLLKKMSPSRMAHFVIDSHSTMSRWDKTEGKRLFVKLCQRVRLPELSDYECQYGQAIHRLLIVLSDQGSDSEGLLDSLVEPLLSRSGPPGRTIIYNVLIPCSWICMSHPHFSSLMKGLTSKLLVAWIAIVVDNDDVKGAKLCIETFFKLKNNPGRPEVDLTPLLHFIGKIDTKDLEFLLSLLHGEINKRNRPPQKTSAPYAQLGRNLIVEFLGREESQEMIKTFEAAQTMFQCLIWLGNESAMESFIGVLSATRDGQRLVVQLALSVGNQPEFAYLSAHHPAGWKMCCALLDHCIEGLGRIWKQTDAVVPGYPDVQTFLRSSSQSMVLKFEDRVDEARRFCEELERCTMKMLVTVKIGESNDKTVRVKIVKLEDEIWQAECSRDWFYYEDRQEKLDFLVALREDRPAATGSKRSADRNSKRKPKAKRSKNN